LVVLHFEVSGSVGGMNRWFPLTSFRWSARIRETKSARISG